MAAPPQSKDPVAEARAHYQAGRKSQAEVICRGVVAREPKNDAAWHLLGVMALEVNREELAIQLFMRALDIAPQKPAYYVNLGAALHRFGKPQEASDALRMAISLKPDLAEAHFNLARCLTDLGDQQAAYLEVERAAELRADSFEIQRHFARTLKLRGESARSIQAYQRAIELDPSSVDCLVEIASVLRSLRRQDDAVVMARRAVELSPESPLANNELGSALFDSERSDEAIAILQKAIALEPSFAPAHASLGYALESVGRLGEAIECFRKVLLLEPGEHAAHSNIIYLLPFLPGVDRTTLLNEARAFNHAYAEPLESLALPHDNDPKPERQLRVGYVSSHFNNHCQSFFTTPLFQNHDRNLFETYAYASVENPDATTERLRASANVWRDVSRLDDAQLAAAVRKDGIDILVDLAMHMGGGKLKAFAEKPAPVQFCWLAYPGTTGLTSIGYRITDRYLDPPELGDGPYSERSVVLPDTFWCYDPLTSEVEAGPLPALANGFVTFGCLNHFRKINDGILKLWSEVLNTVQNSRLVLLAPAGDAQSRICQQLERKGVDRNRVDFVNRRPRLEYLRLYQKIDICLDTHPCGGHTTSLDAFWMGVPVVSLAGPLLVGRAAITLAANLQLDELVLQSAADFVNRAKALAADLSRMQQLRGGLRTQMQSSPLMDGPRFVRNLESAYRAAWRIWCAGGTADRGPIVI
jgi:predicted O-linked N-acetylglucosamine transferase (SPINDLY family)